MPCKVEKIAGGRFQITWTTTQEIPRSSGVSLEAADGFNNPPTTEPTASFELRIFAAADKGTVLDRQLTDLELTASVEPLAPGHAYLVAGAGGTGEVGQPTTAVLHVRAGLLLPAGAVIEVDFPKYTTEGPKSRHTGYFVDEAPACKALKNVDAGVQCTVTKNDDDDVRYEHLTITKALPSGSASADLDLAIEIGKLRNPLSLAARHFPASLSAQGARAPSKLFSIESGTVSWKATKPTTIERVSVTSTDTTVQEYVAYTIQFRPTVDIEAGAYVLVQFPSGGASSVYAFDNKLDSMSTSSGLFGSRRDGVAFNTEAANLKIETKLGTATFRVQGDATMTIKQIKNPAYVGTFGSFTIQVTDKRRELIAQVTTGVSYSTTRGGIEKVKLYPENPLVDSLSRLHLEFAPLHAVAKDSKLKIEITDELTIACPPTVFVYNSAQFRSPLSVSCPDSPGYRALVIDKPYVTDYSYSEG